MLNFKLLTMAAAGMWFGWGWHTSATGMVVGATNASSLTIEMKGFNWLCWHMVTCTLAATATIYTLPLLGYSHPEPSTIIISSVPWLICGLAIFGKSIQLGRPGLYARQYLCLTSVSVLAIASTYF